MELLSFKYAFLTDSNTNKVIQGKTGQTDRQVRAMEGVGWLRKGGPLRIFRSSTGWNWSPVFSDHVNYSRGHKNKGSCVKLDIFKDL